MRGAKIINRKFETQRRQKVLLGLLFLCVGLVFFSDARAVSVERWDFDVYLDDKKVGSHLFEIKEEGGVRQVQSEAAFKVTVLLIPAYRYEHTSSERWRGDCLQNISASTNANGKRLQVEGEIDQQAFQIDTGEEQTQLPECVMTFAYWNPSFLQQPQLLNPQTGEYLDVEVEHDGSEQLTVRGEAVAAQRYTVKAKKVDVTLWYSDDNEWLALESVAKGGRIIRYELS